MPSLENRVAIVTGSSRGIGRGIALALGEQGATVYVTGRSTRGNSTRPDLPETTIDDTAEAVTARGGHGVAVPCDHLDDSQVKSLFERVEQEQGRLDLLVNNAFGSGNSGDPAFWLPFWEQPIEGWEMMSFIRAHLLASRLAVPLMLKYKQGLIINTGFVVLDDFRLHDTNLFFYLTMIATMRTATMMARELIVSGYPIASVALNIGFTRTEDVLRKFGTDERGWPSIASLQNTNSVDYVGRAVASLAADPDILTKTGQVLSVSDLARSYGFTDEDSRQS